MVVLSATACFAADKEHGTVIGQVTLHVTPDANSQQLGRLTRGRDIYLMDHTTVDGKPWSHLLATVDVNTELGTSRDISGWVNSNVVITISTPAISSRPRRTRYDATSSEAWWGARVMRMRGVVIDRTERVTKPALLDVVCTAVLQHSF